MAVSKTTNFGATWTRYNIGVDTGLTYSVAIDPTNGNIVYAGGNEGNTCAIYKTTNGGANWSKCPATGLADTCVYGVALDPDNPSIVYAGTKTGCYKSTNGGTSFTATSCPGGQTNAVLVNSGSAIYEGVYAGTESNGVYWSTNGGSSWTQINQGLIDLSVNCLSLSENTYVYAGTQGGGIHRWSIAVGSEEHARGEPHRTFYAMPNPVKTRTTVHYSLEQNSGVNLSIFDVQGRLVETLINDVQPAGEYALTWGLTSSHGHRVAAGVYFCKLETGTHAAVYKLIVIQ